MQGGGTRPPPLSLPASHTGGRQPAANRPPTRRASTTIDSRLHEVLDADATVPSRGHDHSKNTRCSPPPVQARPGAPPRGARLSPRRGGGATVTVSRAVAPPVAAEVGIQVSLLRKQTPLRLLASRRQHGNTRRLVGGGIGRRGLRPGGRTLFRLPTGWTVFHLPSTLGCLEAVRFIFHGNDRVTMLTSCDEIDQTRARLRLRHAPMPTALPCRPRLRPFGQHPPPPSRQPEMSAPWHGISASPRRQAPDIQSPFAPHLSQASLQSGRREHTEALWPAAMSTHGLCLGEI